MANRFFNQFGKTMAKEVVSLYAHVTFGAAGVPTLDVANSKGIVSVVRNSTGKYTFIFGTDSGRRDTYYKLYHVKHLFDEIATGVAPAAPGMYLTANNVSVATGASAASLQVQFNAAGTATDPANTEGVYLEFVFTNSNAP